LALADNLMLHTSNSLLAYALSPGIHSQHQSEAQLTAFASNSMKVLQTTDSGMATAAQKRATVVLKAFSAGSNRLGVL
jgi:hypothetical protein